MGRGNSKNVWYVNLLKILKLETTTSSGRVNLAGIFILAIFCLLYTTHDAFMYFVSMTSDTIKSVSLQQDISHPYSTTNVFEAVLPILIGFSICLLFLWRNDVHKNKLCNAQKSEVENPIEKL